MGNVLLKRISTVFGSNLTLFKTVLYKRDIYLIGQDHEHFESTFSLIEMIGFYTHNEKKHQKQNMYKNIYLDRRLNGEKNPFFPHIFEGPSSTNPSASTWMMKTNFLLTNQWSGYDIGQLFVWTGPFPVLNTRMIITLINSVYWKNSFEYLHLPLIFSALVGNAIKLRLVSFLKISFESVESFVNSTGGPVCCNKEDGRHGSPGQQVTTHAKHIITSQHFHIVTVTWRPGLHSAFWFQLTHSWRTKITCHWKNSCVFC